MHVENFNIPIRAQSACGLRHQTGQQIDAKAHIAGFDDTRMARRGGNFFFVFGAKAGGADNMDDARLRGQSGELDTGGGHSEIDHRVGAAQNAQRIIAGGDAAWRKARQSGDILAQRIAAFGFQAADQFDARISQNQLGKGLAHATGASVYD